MPENKIVLPKWLVILVITAIILPLASTTISLFAKEHTTAMAQIELDHEKDFKWLKAELLRIERDNKENWGRIDKRTEKLLELATTNSTGVDYIRDEIDRLREGR
jgi:hypothetical protein